MSRPSLHVIEGGHGHPAPAFVPSSAPPRRRVGPLILLWGVVIATGFLGAAGVAWAFNTLCRLVGLNAP